MTINRQHELLHKHLKKTIGNNGIEVTKKIFTDSIEQIEAEIKEPSEQETVIAYYLEDRSDQVILNNEEHVEFNKMMRADKLELIDFTSSNTKSWSCWFDSVDKRYYEVTFVENEGKIKLIQKWSGRVQ